MKSKKTIFKSTISILLSFLMVMSMITFTDIAVKAEISSVVPITSVVPGSGMIPIPGTSSSGNTLNVFMYQQNISFPAVAQLPSPPVSGISVAMQGVLKGFASWACTRAVQELTTLVIKEDIPYLSKALVALQNPATRAELQHKQLVAQMAVSVEEIKASVANIEKQLSDISDKIDQYATAGALVEATNQLNAIVSKYQAAWGNYQSVITAGKKLSEFEEMYPESTRTEEQKAFISVAESEFNMAVTMFLNVIEEGNSYAFLSDLEKLPGYLWNPSDKDSDYNVSYLGAYEAYLRERYPFEHQITEHLAAATQTCIDIQTQMLILYREYYTYKASLDPENETYKAYTPDYFFNIQYGIVLNTAAMIDSTEFSSCMSKDYLTAEKLEEIRKMYPDFVQPETINSEITVDGKTYKAYKIRDNATGEYYKIISEVIAPKTLVEKIYSDSTNKYDTGKDLYRPSFILNGKYSDDGLYEMISNKPAFMDGWSNILSSLRDSNGCDLESIPQNLTHLIFYGSDFSVKALKDAYWTIPVLPLDKASDSPTGKSTIDIYEDSSFAPLVIYKELFTQAKFDENNTLILNDKGLVEGKTFVISSGQTLDLSKISLDISDVKIIINGEGTIISNPDITLKNSSVLVTGTKHGEYAFIKNLNVTAKKHDESALTIKSSCTIAFEGKNSFSGTSAEVSSEDIYKHYNYRAPVFASHGILISGKDTIISIVGVKDKLISYNELQSLTAKGAGGGAGICHNGMNLTIKCLDVTALGSDLSVNSDIYSTGEQLYTIGAGIGSSISCIIKSTGSFSVQTDEKINVFGGDVQNGTNYLSIENSAVSASGTKSSRKISISDSYLGDEIYSEDIGGVKISDGGKYYCFNRGSSSASTIKATNLRISSRFTNGGDNIYDPDYFTITAYTKGSNGVTTDGVYFKLKGEKGETDWMYASDCGNDKGDWTGTVKGVSVGKINAVEVKTKSSNHWYPGKITISGQWSQESITVWGGRWISNSGTTLSPGDNVYEVSVTTGSSANSGTDANISLYLKDNKGNTTSTVDLSDINQYNNAFEKGDTDTFPIYAPNNFEECTNAFFHSDHSNAAAGWMLSSFTINQVQGGSDGFTFESGQWFEKAGYINFGKYSGDTGSFYLEVKTKNSSGAGTNSDIWLTIYGTNGNTGEIELDTYAGDGDNFEKGDLDCFHVGVDKSIGTIEKITVRKNNGGAGPDWDLEYIEISEEVSKSSNGQSVKFTIDKTIKDSSYTFTLPAPVVKSAQRIDRELLKGLSKNEDGSYTLSVNRTVTISEEIFEILKEQKITLTVEMKNEDKTIYAVLFNGEKITDYSTITLSKGYSFADGKAMIDLLSSAHLPAGSKVMIHTENLGFVNSDKLALFEKDENGKWKESISLVTIDGIIEISIEEVKELLISKKGSTPSDEIEEDASADESTPPQDEDENTPSQDDDENIPSPGDSGYSLYFSFALISLACFVYMFKRKASTRS